ncbi:MAG: GNAT family N-acetyltransferase [Ruminococcaceae bacterium]|nr:GNAT family N-acetyltransferase [Oscillospiraceae bacterium]
MKEKNNIIGFTSISLKSKDVVDIPYDYGKVKDFYIAPKYRRKGFGRILNNYIEDVFIKNKTNVVLLSPDPVSGIDFWKAMGYNDTGIHKGWGKHFVYIKHLSDNKTSLKIDSAILELITPTDLIGINPYNKPQLKEVYCIWKEYCKDINQKQRRSDVKNMAWNARKHKNISFRAVYYEGKIIGFKYKAYDEINYILPEYRTKLLR